jgi:hypothetical protein
MSRPLEALAQEVLSLPPALRASLLDRVVASLDADLERDAAWDAVAAARDAELDSGLVEPVPLDNVMERLRAELR